MANKLSGNDLNKDAFSGIISSDKFSEYTPDVQNRILDSLENRSRKEGGLMGKIFGTKKGLSEMFVALAICLILVAIGVFVNTESIWDKIIPIFAATTGYIFGRGKGSED